MKLRFIITFNYLSVVLALVLLPLSSHAAEMGHDHQQHDQHKQLDTISGEEDPHANHKAMMKKPTRPAETTRVDLLDRQLVDQNGDEVSFLRDVIGDRIVIMDFIYTTCTTVCPVISAVFSQVQDRVGDELGQEIVLVSVSVDAIRDTPQRLKAYAATHKAKPGWKWLTGKKRVMDEVAEYFEHKCD